MPIPFKAITANAVKKAVSGLAKIKPKLTPISPEKREAQREKVYTSDEKRQAKRLGKKQARKELSFDEFKKTRVPYPKLDQAGKLARLEKIQLKHLQAKKPEYYSIDEIKERVRPPTAAEAAERAKTNPMTKKEARQYEKWKDK